MDLPAKVPKAILGLLAEMVHLVPLDNQAVLALLACQGSVSPVPLLKEYRIILLSMKPMIPRLVAYHNRIQFLAVWELLAHLVLLAPLVNQAHLVLMDIKVPLVSLDSLALLDLPDLQD